MTKNCTHFSVCWGMSIAARTCYIFALFVAFIQEDVAWPRNTPSTFFRYGLPVVDYS